MTTCDRCNGSGQIAVTRPEHAQRTRTLIPSEVPIIESDLVPEATAYRMACPDCSFPWPSISLDHEWLPDHQWMKGLRP